MNERPASFSARVVAFAVDVALAAAGYFLSLKLLFRNESVWGSGHAGLFVTLWMAAFLLYQAYMSCEGRRSAGKSLVGLRVVDAEGQPLEPGRAALRSAAYLLSSIANLGFAWSLADKSGRGWHDLIAGTLVVEDEPMTSRKKWALRAGAALCIAFFAGLWYWRHVVKPRYDRLMWVAGAKQSLEEIKVLERKFYKDQGGIYAATIEQLADTSVKPEEFLQDTRAMLDVESGVVFSTSPTTFSVRARARDDLKTELSITGP